MLVNTMFDRRARVTLLASVDPLTLLPLTLTPLTVEPAAPLAEKKILPMLPNVLLRNFALVTEAEPLLGSMSKPAYPIVPKATRCTTTPLPDVMAVP